MQEGSPSCAALDAEVHHKSKLSPAANKDQHKAGFSVPIPEYSRL
jgi:hypothetical protein